MFCKISFNFGLPYVFLIVRLMILPGTGQMPYHDISFHHISSYHILYTLLAANNAKLDDLDDVVFFIFFHCKIIFSLFPILYY